MAAKKFPLAIVIEALDRASGPLVKVENRINRVAAPVRRLHSRFVQLGKVAGLPKVADGLRGVRAGLGGLGSALGTTLTRTTFLAGGAAAALAALVRSHTQYGDTVAKQAARIGIGVESLQELRFAADRAGVPIEKLDKALLDMGKRIGEARSRTGALYTLLDRADPALLRQLERTTDQGEAFRILVGALQGATDAQTKLAVANAAFGRAGPQLLALTKDGTAGLDEMAARARELGLVLSSEDARAAEVFEDSLTDLFSSLSGLRNLIGSALVPELRRLVEQAIAWVLRVRPQVQAFAREFAAGLPERIRNLVAWFKRAAEQSEPLIQAGKWLLETFGPFNVLAGALAVTLGGPVLSALVALTPAVYALGTAILTTPIGWILAGIAAVITAGWALYSQWDRILGFLGFLWDSIVGSIKGAYDWLLQLIGLAPDSIGSAFGDGGAGSGGTLAAAPVSGAELFAAGAGGAGASRDDRVRVIFDNLPQGARVQEERGSDGLELDVGFAMGTP